MERAFDIETVVDMGQLYVSPCDTGMTPSIIDASASPRESSRGSGRNERVEPAYCRRAVGVHRLTPSPVAIVRPLP